MTDVVADQVVPVEPWLDKRQLAEHLGNVSVRWIAYRVAEGMPHAMIAGRTKFRVSECEPWLAERGFIERR